MHSNCPYCLLEFTDQITQQRHQIVAYTALLRTFSKIPLLNPLDLFLLIVDSRMFQVLYFEKSGLWFVVCIGVAQWSYSVQGRPFNQFRGESNDGQVVQDRSAAKQAALADGAQSKSLWDQVVSFSPTLLLFVIGGAVVLIAIHFWNNGLKLKSKKSSHSKDKANKKHSKKNTGKPSKKNTGKPSKKNKSNRRHSTSVSDETSMSENKSRFTSETNLESDNSTTNADHDNRVVVSKRSLERRKIREKMLMKKVEELENKNKRHKSDKHKKSKKSSKKAKKKQGVVSITQSYSCTPEDKAFNTDIESYSSDEDNHSKAARFGSPNTIRGHRNARPNQNGQTSSLTLSSSTKSKSLPNDMDSSTSISSPSFVKLRSSPIPVKRCQTKGEIISSVSTGCSANKICSHTKLPSRKSDKITLNEIINQPGLRANKPARKKSFAFSADPDSKTTVIYDATNKNPDRRRGTSFQHQNASQTNSAQVVGARKKGEKASNQSKPILRATGTKTVAPLDDWSLTVDSDDSSIACSLGPASNNGKPRKKKKQVSFSRDLVSVRYI